MRSRDENWRVMPKNISVHVIFRLPGSHCLCGAEPTLAEYVGSVVDELSSEISISSMPEFYSHADCSSRRDIQS